MSDTALELTGERTLPGIPRENYWYARHVVAYRFAESSCGGKSVVDVGCGEGYGTAMLAETAREVVGVDVAPEIVRHAGGRYRADNLTFVVGDVSNLPLASSRFDVAVSLQVVEHLLDVSGYFEEMVRVLAPGGTAILTTPNRHTISPGSDTPINPFHLREYSPGEFLEELSSHFERVELSGVFHAGWLKLNERLKLVDFVKVYEMGRLNPRYLTHGLLTPLVRPRDFRVESSDVEGCLDILAVCSKARGGGSP